MAEERRQAAEAAERTSVAAKRGELGDGVSPEPAGGARGPAEASARAEAEVTLTDPGATPQPTRAGGTATSTDPRQGD